MVKMAGGGFGSSSNSGGEGGGVSAVEGLEGSPFRPEEGKDYDPP